MRDPVTIYDEQAADLAERYERMATSEAFPGLNEYLRAPDGTLLALDVGARANILLVRRRTPQGD